MLPDNCDFKAKFNEFNEILGKVINKFASAEKASRKQKRWKNKPWIFFSLVKSIQRKKQWFLKLMKLPQIDSESYKNYKVYRNTLNRAIANAKRIYYNNLCCKNSDDQKTMWNTVYEIVNPDKKKSSSQ